MLRRIQTGATMADFLVSVFVLGIIASHSIPKIFHGSANLQRRYSIALESYGAVHQLMANYRNENGGCYPGLSCGTIIGLDAFNVPITTDGLPGETLTMGDPAMLSLYNYLDTHLNYTRKVVFPPSPWPWYYLSSGATITPGTVRYGAPRPGGQAVVYAKFYLFLDRTPEEANGLNFQGFGVDSPFVDSLRFYRTGESCAGYTHCGAQSGSGLYDQESASIFDWKDHPEDTCSAIGPPNGCLNP